MADQTSPAKEAGLILERAFEYDYDDNPDEFIAYAQKHGFDADHDQDYVWVRGPHRDVKSFVSDSDYRHLVGREDSSRSELYMGNLRMYMDQQVAADGGEEIQTMKDVDHEHPHKEGYDPRQGAFE